MMRSFEVVMMTGFMFYGIFRFVTDYLVVPIGITADYIDSTGMSFWVCLALAAIVVAIIGIRSK